jgi:hypothetical protein
MSFGLYNTLDEVDRFIEALGRIARRDFAGDYRQNAATGEYLPAGWEPDFSRILASSTPSTA